MFFSLPPLRRFSFLTSDFEFDLTAAVNAKIKTVNEPAVTAGHQEPAVDWVYPLT